MNTIHAKATNVYTDDSSIDVNPGAVGGRDPQILKWGSWRGVGVVEGVVSGLLRGKGEGREPRTRQFSNQIGATGQQRYDAKRYKSHIEQARISSYATVKTVCLT
jgi:hypothetical protein